MAKRPLHRSPARPLDDTRTRISPAHTAERAAMARAARPKLAATIVLVRFTSAEPEILMGQRSKGHDFMPSIYVFPGGRVDRCDSYAPFATPLNPRTRRVLEAHMPPARARACVLATIRETFEETGLALGHAGRPNRNVNSKSWDAFHDLGYVADLSRIDVFGRAITPPYRPKRFDTWFFCTRLDDEIAQRPFSDSAELINTAWFTFDAALALDIHVITKMMINEARDFIARDNPPPTLPFSRFERGAFKLDPIRLD